MASYPTQTITPKPKTGYAPGGIDTAPAQKTPVLKAGAAPTPSMTPAPTSGAMPVAAPQPVLKPGAPPTGGGTPSAQPIMTPQPVSLPGPSGTGGAPPMFTDMQYKGPNLPNTPGDPLARGGQGGATAAPAGSMITTNMSQIQPSTGAMPGPGATPIGTGMIPAAPSNPYTTQFGPGNDLQTTQINPAANPRLQGTQSAVDAATASLAGAPSRQQAAADQFAAFLGSQGEEFDRRSREITQRAGATGRLGSGMYGSDLVDTASAFNRDAQRQASQLAYDTVGGDIQDRFNTVGTLAGLEGQQVGQGLTQRNELRGERDYQNGYAQQGFNNTLTQFGAEQGAQNQAAQQQLALLGLQGQYGYGGQNPSGLLGSFAGDIQQSAGQTGAGAGDLLTQWLLSQAGG